MTFAGIRAKIDHLRANLVELARLPQDRAPFLADAHFVYAAIYLLQTSVQALIDLGIYVTARLGLSIPSRSADILDALEQAGHLPAGSTLRFRPMFAFRNRVVHLYDRVEPDVVHRIATTKRADLEELLRLLLVALESTDVEGES